MLAVVTSAALEGIRNVNGGEPFDVAVVLQSGDDAAAVLQHGDDVASFEKKLVIGSAFVV